MAYATAIFQIKEFGKRKQMKISLHNFDRATFDAVPVVEHLVQPDQPGAKCFWVKDIEIKPSGSRGPITITLYCKEPPNA